MILLVQCPRCKNRMKYRPVSSMKKKRCVYCSHTFSVHPDQEKSRVVKTIS